VARQAEAMPEWRYTQGRVGTPVKDPEDNVGDCTELVQESHARAGVEAPYTTTGGFARSSAWHAVPDAGVHRGTTWVSSPRGGHAGVVVGIDRARGEVVVQQNGGRPGYINYVIPGLLVIPGFGYVDGSTVPRRYPIKGSAFFIYAGR
jgi:hypothetical protein